ncbi:hypothetical protein L3Q72_12745 [Vibrio sp. JC009]|uniref:AAA family ATPase n=1 Tax=Vibrio sp. JC009 TaxID=2912314 RepID=UPI0023B0FC27|nr:hypothetical protein [Vibrio sp. JC009]WED21484.1 hypothetical protein L3Q72_12745 [Vibrio sp. JC009]
MHLTINKLKKSNIFTEEYLALKENNIIDFMGKNVCVIYGPNGTGKTSFSKVLEKNDSEYDIQINGETFTQNDDAIAHIISDQNDRNIIQGETQDFILGDEIKREYMLKEKINDSFSKLFTNDIPKVLKSKYGISTKNSPFDDLILDKPLLSFISDIANTKSKGKNIDRRKYIDHISALEKEEAEYDEVKFSFFVNDFKSKTSSIRTILDYDFELKGNEKKLVKLEEQNEAVGLLSRFDYIEDCLVCDNHINAKDLLIKKTDQIKKTSDSLDDKEKEIAERIVNGLPINDPFSIRNKVRLAITNSDRGYISDLVEDLNLYKSIYNNLIKNFIIETTGNYDLSVDLDEYEKLLKKKPEFATEDILFIEKFLNEALDREITLERDKENNLKLLLGDKEFLNHDRKKLSLSNGEQNFLSLSFEILKAKNSKHELIVLDDPISSFDSIYKNKLAYAILSILKDKKTLVLTHNTDLIKLLEHQRKNCLNLYYFNNTVGENNGFININENEVKILLYIHEILSLLREDIKHEINDEKDFLISVIPFMRGYCQILGKNDEKQKLTDIMHGYKNIKVNVTDIYNNLFSSNVISSNHIISAQDIIGMDSDNFKPLKDDNFPLLAKTLRHTITYLYLRLKVEKELSAKYNVNTNKKEMLTDIIMDSFKGLNPEAINNRVFFMSRKTLLNEFNHFEMDMNIFQPAIDITDKSLAKEKTQILEKLENL